MLQISISFYECIAVSKIGTIVTRQSVSTNFENHITERKLSKRVRMGPSQSFGIVTPEPPEIEKGIKLIAREGEKKFSKKRVCGRFELSWEIHMKDQRRRSLSSCSDNSFPHFQTPFRTGLNAECDTLQAQQEETD